ncbi:MAG: hypothetical protein COB04_02185 [Gammaproteobacteria bacterium]|nr:MAG: hypothetical protein COB04_02185 [Gammaproteobacteria bacterium]
MSNPESQVINSEIVVDFTFKEEQPMFGDLFTIVGHGHQSFRTSGRFIFHHLEDLYFSQVKEFFGVKSMRKDGDEVMIWMYPLIDGEIAGEHKGPFSGMRIRFNLLRNPENISDHFVRVFKAFESQLKTEPSRSLESVETEIVKIKAFWKDKNIALGSEQALAI